MSLGMCLGLEGHDEDRGGFRNLHMKRDCQMIGGKGSWAFGLYAVEGSLYAAGI